MIRIFSRRRRSGNVLWALWRSAGIALVTGGLVLSGCASLPRVPANVILRDVHNNGYALTFDSRSKILASGGSEGRIRLWALPDGTEITGWLAHDGSIQGLQFLVRDQEILSAGYDGVLARWSRDGTLLQRLVTPSPIIDMALDEDTAQVITGHRDGVVRLWHLSDFSVIRELPLHDGAIRAVAYHSATRRVASSGTDGRVFHWVLDKQPAPLPPPPTDAQDLAFSPDGQWLMGGGWFKLFRWRMQDETLEILTTAHRGIVKSISFDRDGRRLASIGRQTDSAVYLLDAQTGKVITRFQPHELCGTFVRLSPDGRYLASTSDDANVHLWDLRHPLPEQTFFPR
jgi:WD40 repeat protein